MGSRWGGAAMGGGTTARAAEPLLAPVEAGGRRKPRLAALRCHLTGRGCSPPQRAPEVGERHTESGCADWRKVERKLPVSAAALTVAQRLRQPLYCVIAFQRYRAVEAIVLWR